MKTFKSYEKFGDVINKEQIANWNSDVILEGGTATGKTYFALNNLKDYCIENNKKILFLCNRLKLSQDVKKDAIEYKATDIVKIETYQSLENRIKKNILLFDLEGYDYIVCDEYHYFTNDSSFNIYTDISYDWIKEQKGIKIYMSATCESLFKIYLNKEYVNLNNHYYIPKDYSYVEKIVFYSRRNDADLIIDNIMKNTDDKIIYFCQSMEKLIEMYRKYNNDATFFCSKWTKNEIAKEILKENEDKIHNMTFEGRILIASSALDVGVTLKDYKIKHVIADIFDHSTLQQCLGRKRTIDGNDTCTFYIRTYSKRELNMYRRTKTLDEMILFNRDRETFNNTYINDREYKNEYIYYDKNTKDFKMNRLAFVKLIEDANNLDIMQYESWYDYFGNEHFGIGYQSFILGKLKCPQVPIEYYDNVKEEVNKMNLVEYLDSIVGKKLFKDEQYELKEEFVKDGLKARSIGINTLNGNLKDRKLPYMIISKMTSTIVNGKKKNLRYWEVANNIEI